MAKKASKTKRQAPAEWQGAVDASEEQDNDGTGVVHENGEKLVLEKIDPATLAVQAHEMARLVGERTVVNEEKLDSMRSFNNRLKGLDDRIREIAGEVESGMRKVPAQKSLPGTESRA